MSELISPLVWRCDVSGNPVGTDTRMVGAPPCLCQGCRASVEIERAQQALCEVANRAGNYLDDDAVEWMPSIYNVAVNAINGKPLSLDPPDDFHTKEQQKLWKLWRPQRADHEQT